MSDADDLRLWQPPITGEVIMQTFGIPPSKEVGVIKTAVRETILNGEIPNEFEAAFGWMVEEGKKIGLVARKGEGNSQAGLHLRHTATCVSFVRRALAAVALLHDGCEGVGESEVIFF